MESCRSFESFILNASLKIVLVHFFMVTRSISSCCLWGLVVFFLICSLMPKVKILSLWSEIVKRFLGLTHVFGRNFTFFDFVFNGGALNSLQNVVE